jgi:circadian clock protein KaiC
MECIDRIVGGGFPAGGMITVSGPCGSGKTLFAMEYLIRGALAGQKGVFISTSHRPEKLLTFVPKLDYADEKLFESGKLVMKHIDDLGSGERDDGKITRAEAKAIVEDIASAINEAKASRFVLDAINPLLLEMEEWVARSFLLALSNLLFEKKCTGILISEGESLDTLEHRVSDGIVRLSTAVRRGDNYRVLEVVKMSGAAHSRAKYVMDMTSEGMLVTPMLRGV